MHSILRAISAQTGITFCINKVMGVFMSLEVTKTYSKLEDTFGTIRIMDIKDILFYGSYELNVQGFKVREFNNTTEFNSNIIPFVN